MDETFNKLKKIPFYGIVSTRLKEAGMVGREFKAICPWHDDHTPSFNVFRNKEGDYLYKCLACGVNGNVVQFVQKFDGCSTPEAIEKVKKELEWEEGKEITDATFSLPVSRREFKTYPLAIMEPLQRSLAENRGAMAWLEGRGLKLATAQKLGWGYIEDLSAVSSSHPWVKEGWIAIPTLKDGNIISMKYRSIKGKKTEDKKSGFLRLPDMVTCLYNLEAINSLEDAFLVEGEPDCAILTQAGYNTTSLPSAEYTMTPQEKDKLVSANRLFLAGDMDEVGSAAMRKLWTDIQDRVYLIEWPDNCKDANETFLKTCKGNMEDFQKTMEYLIAKALERLTPNFYDIRQTLKNIHYENPMSNPRRLHMRDPDVDNMAVNLPGNVVGIFANYSGVGKTTWAADMFEIPAAMKGSVVLNYSAELSPDEFGTLVTANLLGKDRLSLEKKDFDKAAKMLDSEDAKFYVGYNPDITEPEKVMDVLEWGIRRFGARIVVLDHLHFYTTGDDATQQQARAMQRAKNLARKYDVVFVMLGQGRKKMQGKSHEDTDLHDAKGSEAFGSVCSTVYLLDRKLRKDIDPERPETWPSDPLDNRTDVKLLKCRTKGPGKSFTRQTFRGTIGRFERYASEVSVSA